ncbi:MAG: tetratricopeptide repeat protein [Fuerstiella sp.]
MKRLLYIVIPLLVVGLTAATWLVCYRPVTYELPQPNLAGYPAFTRAKIEEALASVRPDIALDWHDLADTLFAGGFYAEAEACYQHSVTLDPAHPRFRYHWAFCLFSIGDIAESDRQFHQAIEQGHSSPAACQHFIGLNALREGRSSCAQRAFEESSELAVSRLKLAELAIQDNNPDQAAELLNELLKEQPNSWRVYHLLAVAAHERGDKRSRQQYSAFADVLSEEIRGPWHSRAGIIQTLSLEMDVQHRIDAALEQLQRPQNINRVAEIILAENVEAWDPLLEELLSNIDLAQEDRKSQVERLQRVIKKDGADSYRTARLGFALLAQQNTTAAERIFETGIHLLSGNQTQQAIDMCGALAELRKQAGNMEAANRVTAWGEFLQGTQLLEELSIPLAAEAFARSVELDDSPARSWFWLGRCRQLLGQNKAAATALDECLTRNPHHERAIRNRHALSLSPAGIPADPALVE